MQLTWLDILVKNWADKVPKSVRRELNLETDVEAARQILTDFVDAARLRIQRDVPATEQERWSALNIDALYDSVLPFLADNWPKEPLGILVVPDLAADLAGASPPDSEAWWQPIEEAASVYIEFPHKALLTGSGRELRALFIRDLRVFGQTYRDGPYSRYEPTGVTLQSGDGSPPPFRFCAVVTPEGRDAPEQVLGWVYRRTDANAPSGEEVLAERARMEIEEFARLVLLYFLTASPADRTLLFRVENRRLAGLSKKKQRAKAKQGTLFRVVKLAAPADRFGRTDADRDKGGWTLGVRVRVRGHFRLQPYGPSGRLRRLQWIASYEKGPSDAPFRPRLHKLLLPESDEAHDRALEGSTMPRDEGSSTGHSE